MKTDFGWYLMMDLAINSLSDGLLRSVSFFRFASLSLLWSVACHRMDIPPAKSQGCEVQALDIARDKLLLYIDGLAGSNVFSPDPGKQYLRELLRKTFGAVGWRDYDGDPKADGLVRTPFSRNGT